VEEEVKSIDWEPFQAEFPNLFRDAELAEMGVGEGWTELLWDLCASIETMAARGAEAGVPFRISQVKEKFGGLRFYVKGTTVEAWTLIHEAEIKSEGICEACGAPGNRSVIGNWLKTLCVVCQMRLGARSSHGGGWNLEGSTTD
jgi:hypothetical protein